MHLAFSIRHEKDQDIPGIWTVNHEAFGRMGEADLIDALRIDHALTLSVVAVSGEQIIGHVGFSPVAIGERHGALALAPVAVAPAFQGKRVGSALIQWALDECALAGHEVVIVLGSPAYYGRFGFVPAGNFGIECPFSAPPDHFMALELMPDAARGMNGMVRYHPEFEKV